MNQKNGVLYPDVTVQLTGEDGNAFAIIGKVSKALKRANYGNAARKFEQAAISGDYDHLLRTAMKYVNVE